MKPIKWFVSVGLAIVLFSSTVFATSLNKNPNDSKNSSSGELSGPVLSDVGDQADSKANESNTSSVDDASDNTGEPDESIDGSYSDDNDLDSVSYNRTEGCDDDTVSADEVSDGGEPDGTTPSQITITGGVEGVDYTRSDDGTINIKTSTPLLLDGHGGDNSAEQIVLGVAGDEAEDINVTIKDINIKKTTENAPLKIIDSFGKDVNLLVEGTNILQAGPGHAGLEKFSHAENGYLTISGNGSLTATGNEAPGIGGEDTANITIDDGFINAKGRGTGAGIGCRKEDCLAENITINGGIVTAETEGYSAIGGGETYSDDDTITINGGTVFTSSPNGGGIGDDSKTNNIVINNGTVNVSGAIIGNRITINNGTVISSSPKNYSVEGLGCIEGNHIEINNAIIKTGTIGGHSININSGKIDVTHGGIWSVDALFITGGTITVNKQNQWDSAITVDEGGEFIIDNASLKLTHGEYVKEMEAIPLNKKGGERVYPVTVPNYGTNEVAYRIHGTSIWKTLSFSAFHDNDNSFYLWLPSGIYDFKSGDNISESIPVGYYTSTQLIPVSTRKIVLDNMLGSRLEIMSNDRYKVDDLLYDCSSASDTYFIDQISTVPFESKHIVISGGDEVTINNLNIKPSKQYAPISDLSKSDLVIRAVEGSCNTLVGNSYCSGIEKPLRTGKLTLTGKGTIIAIGGEFAAGIGGSEGIESVIYQTQFPDSLNNYNSDTSDIVIDGCTINATGGDGAAGIGGRKASKIRIVDGLITAKGSGGAPGIGGGSECTDLLIDGGKITAISSGDGAGIGAGSYGTSNVIINGGTITAESLKSGTGIGAGAHGVCNGITITGGNINAHGNGSHFNVGIGCGNNGECASIFIKGGNINTMFKYPGSNIGVGQDSSIQNIFVSGGNIYTKGFSVTPVRSIYDSEPLVLKTVGGYSTGEAVPFSTIDGAEYYNLNDVVSFTDGFYFYLPESISVNAYNKYSVSFHSQCGFAIEDRSYRYGSLIDEPNGVVYNGYNLLGWYTTPNPAETDKPWDFQKDQLKGDLDLYAKWGPGCIVVFDTGCDDKIPSQTVKSGDKVRKPEDPTKDGYLFDGWYVSYPPKSTDLKWDFENDVVDKSMILHAGWIVDDSTDESDTELIPALDGTYNYTMLLGEKYPVKITGVNKKSLRSDDSKIASVTKKGVIQGNKVGSTDIRCLVNGEEKTIHVDVTFPAISAKKNHVLVGESLPLSVKGTPINNIKWVTNNSCAYITEDGILTGNKAGTVKASAIIHKKKYTVVIKVENPRFAKTQYSVKAGKYAKIALSGTKQGMRVSYSIDDEGVATILPDGRIAGLAPGTTTLRATLGPKTFTTNIKVY